MNSKKKKLIGVIVALAIVAIGILALWYMGPSLYETEEPVEVNTAEDTLLYEEDMNPQPLGMERYIYTFNKTEGDYIWLDIDTEIDFWSVYSVTRESMEGRLNELGPFDRGMRVTDMETVKESAELIIKNFGVKKEKLGMNNYMCYAAPIYISCLNDFEFKGGRDDILTITPLLNEEGLILSYENVSAGRAMVDTASDGDFYVEVTADVTCEENSGLFKGVEWIPAKGKTSKVTFLVEFRAVDGPKNEIYVHNVGVIK